ncbi:MAG: DNA translocase FtsK [Clostridia bacterium]
MAVKNTKQNHKFIVSLLATILFLLISVCLFGKNAFGGLVLLFANLIIGIFGVSSYILSIVALIISLLFLIGYKIQIKKGYIVNFTVMAVSIVLLIHLITSRGMDGLPLIMDKSYSYGTYLTACYNMSITTFGGAFCGLLIYPLYKYIGVLGSYIVYIGTLGVTLFFASNCIINKEFKLYRNVNEKEKVNKKNSNEIIKTKNDNNIKPLKKEENKDVSVDSVIEKSNENARMAHFPNETIVIPNPRLFKTDKDNNDNNNDTIPKKVAKDTLYGDFNKNFSLDNSEISADGAREMLFPKEALGIGEKQRKMKEMSEKASYTRSYEDDQRVNGGNNTIRTAEMSAFSNSQDGVRPPKIIHENPISKPFNSLDNGELQQKSTRTLNISNIFSANPYPDDSRRKPEVSENKDLLKYKESDIKENLDLPPIINGDEYCEKYKKDKNVQPKKTIINKYGYEEIVDDNLNNDRNPIITAFDNLTYDIQKDDKNNNNSSDMIDIFDNAIEDNIIDKAIAEKQVDSTIKNAVEATPIRQKTVAIMGGKQVNTGNGSGVQMSVTEIDSDSTLVLRTYKPKAYKAPPLSLLQNPPAAINAENLTKELNETGIALEQTLAEYRIKANVKNIISSASVALYEMELAPGVPIKSVNAIQEDIARHVSASGPLRIISQIQGKNLFGIEIPLKNKTNVYLKTVIDSTEFKVRGDLRFALGINIQGKCVAPDLGDMPHLLLGGSTGYGKSVCLNSLIISLMYKYSPEELRFILVDPKRVEFNDYIDMPHMLMPKPLVTSEKALNAFSWLVNEMERRYAIFSECHVKNIGEYNQMIDKNIYEPIPRIVLVVDELSDLMSYNKPELEGKILRLTQKARAAGIHVVLATQRPSVDVITGTIKSNLPARLALKVVSANDSKTIFDTGGPEKLSGKGDMLYQKDGATQRLQGAYVSGGEVRAIVDYIKSNNECHYNEEAEKLINEAKKSESEKGNNAESENSRENDPYFVEALKLAITTGTASISMIQRKFKIGFGRAGNLVEAMELRGYVGKQETNKPRIVLFTKEQFNETYGDEYGEI